MLETPVEHTLKQAEHQSRVAAYLCWAEHQMQLDAAGLDLAASLV